MYFILRQIVLLLLLIFPVAAVNATDLNAAVTEHPTVGSEILRGAKAASECGGNHVSDADGFWSCIYDTSNAYEQKHTSYEPFNLGIFFGGWLNQDLEYQVMDGLAPKNVLAQKSLPDYRRQALGKL